MTLLSQGTFLNAESRSDRIGFSKYFKKVPLKPSCWLEWWGSRQLVQAQTSPVVVQVWREFSSRFFLGPVLSLVTVYIFFTCFPCPLCVRNFRLTVAPARGKCYCTSSDLQNCRPLQQRVLCCPWQILLEFVILLMMSHCIPNLFFWSKKSHVATARSVQLVRWVNLCLEF